MTMVTLRPNGTLIDNAYIITGAATIHEALADDDDGSSVRLDAAHASFKVSLDDFTLPAGAVVVYVQNRIRQSQATAVYAPVAVSSGLGGYYLFTPTTGAVTIAAPARYGPQLEGAVDGDAIVVSSDDVDVYELFYDVVYALKPTAIVTAPSGTITTTNRPTVTWTYVLDTAGGNLTRWEMKVFSAAQYGAGGFDPDTSTPTYATGIRPMIADGHPMTSVLPDGTYRAYVRLAQTINGAYHWSDWDYEAFAVLVELPATPSIALTAQDDNACIRIELTDNAGDATTTGFELQRSSDGGTTWVAVRNTLGLDEYLVGDEAVVLDYEAPNGRISNYRARAIHDYGDGLYGFSDWEIDDAMWSSSQWWLKHPNLPPLNLPVTVRGYRSVQRASRQGVITALGARLPLVVSEVRSGARGVVVLHAEDLLGLDALEALLDENATFLLHGPADADEPDRYVRIGDEDASRLVDNAAFHRRDVTLPWIEVAMPDGAMTGEYGDEEGMLL